MMNRLCSDEEIIQMLRKGGSERQKAWEYMFKNWQSYFRNKIQQYGGTADEALHALSSVCIGWEKRVCSDSFTLDSVDLKNYLGKSVFYAFLRMKKQSPPHAEEIEEERLAKQVAEEPLVDTELQSILSNVLEKSVGEKCRKILYWQAGGYSMKEIGSLLNILPESAKNQKSKCLKKLIEHFKKHPEKVQTIKKMLYG